MNSSQLYCNAEYSQWLNIKIDISDAGLQS